MAQIVSSELRESHNVVQLLVWSQPSSSQLYAMAHLVEECLRRLFRVHFDAMHSLNVEEPKEYRDVSELFGIGINIGLVSKK